MEHQSNKKEKYSQKQKAIATGMALTAFIGFSGMAGPAIRADHAGVVAERYIPPEKRETPPVLDPEFTIIVPSQAQDRPIDWTAKSPTEDELRERGQWCNTPDVPLFRRATSEQIAKAGEVRMGLSAVAYDQVAEKLESSESRQESEAIVRATLEGVGVKATFNKYKEGLATESVQYVTNDADYDLYEYNRKLLEQMDALTDMPLEMAQAPDSVDFIDADKMATIQKDGSQHGIDGYFVNETGNARIVIRLGSGKRVALHEWAHAMHYKACENPTPQQDSELRQAYQEAIKLLGSNKSVKRLEDHWPKDEIDSSQHAWFSPKHGDVTGFPSQYSKSDYGELFADLSTDLLLRGDIPDAVGYESDQARRLKQLVVERMQTAAPSADIASLVAAKAAYEGSDYHGASLQRLLAKHVSPADRTYAAKYNELGVNGELVPAINIKSFDGSRNEFIYAYQSDRMMTPEGMYGGQYGIYLRDTGEEMLDKRLIETSLKYLRHIADEKDITLSYEVRRFGDELYILSNYEADGAQKGASHVEWNDFTGRNAQGTGG